MESTPTEPYDDGQDVPTPSDPNDRGPYRFPSKEDDPDQVDDNPRAPISDDADEEAEEDLDATGRFHIMEQLNLPKAAW